jgi:alpha-L-fucosidase
MQINGEAIYETRPWKVYGEGPNQVKAGSFQGHSISKLGPKDIRFTRNKANNVVYAIALGWPGESIVIQSLGLSAETKPGKVAKVELGMSEKVNWKQNRCSASIRRRYQGRLRGRAQTGLLNRATRHNVCVSARLVHSR